MVGDPTLFIRTDEVEQAWRIVDPILGGVEAADGAPIARYRGGHLGPGRGRPHPRARPRRAGMCRRSTDHFGE